MSYLPGLTEVCVCVCVLCVCVFAASVTESQILFKQLVQGITRRYSSEQTLEESEVDDSDSVVSSRSDIPNGRC